MSGHTARLFTDTKALLKFVRWPKSTPTGEALREWLASFNEKPKPSTPSPEWAKINAELDKRIDLDKELDDPTANTKMVT